MHLQDLIPHLLAKVGIIYADVLETVFHFTYIAMYVLSCSSADIGGFPGISGNS